MTDRLLAYVRRLAATDWGEPSGFAGRTCFQAIPPLELERRGEDGGVFRAAWIRHSLELLRQRKDCQDFAMVGLLRLLLRYPQSQLLDATLRQEIGAALLGAKYAEHDPGADSCCWHTENHQVQYAASELLVGQLFPDAVFTVSGRTGAWHRQRAAQRLQQWLGWRRRFGFSEWNSSCYYDEDAAALLNVADFAADDRLRREAQAVFERLCLHVAHGSWRGITGGSQGRTYLAEQIEPDQTPMAILAQLGWGGGEVPHRLALGAVALSTSGVRVPDAAISAGRDLDDDGAEHRERHGLDADEGAANGVDPADPANLPFWLGAGQEHHHLVVEARHAWHQGREKWPGFFADRAYYQRCREQGADFDPWQLPHGLGRAELCTFRTRDYMLGCALDYHPGAPGYQQFLWCATLGRRAVVFTTNPAPADVPYGRPGPWVGNGVLPKVVQHRNVLIALHRVRPCPILGDAPWFRQDRVHAWFPRGAFDEVVERAGWCCARKDGGYIGLRPLAAADWLPPQPDLCARIGSDQPYEWNVAGTDVAWICEMGSAQSHGPFASFVERLAAARVAGDVDQVIFDSPSLGLVETGWRRGLSVAGRSIPLRSTP
jgi:hypothetical protein